MSDLTSSLWHTEIPPDFWNRLSGIISSAGEKRETPLKVLFRADDIAEIDHKFDELMHLFMDSRTPLCLAVVPTWLETNRWQEMSCYTPDNPLWCWHQHGWSHENHEPIGKKQEFGPNRSNEAIGADLRRGKEKLETIMGETFYPVFTPPWNRCSQITMEYLQKNGFQAISRYHNAQPTVPAGLPEINLNIDLHTRKESDPQTSWNNLLHEFETAAGNGFLGIMIHHQRMNQRATHFLKLLLEQLLGEKNTERVNFKDIIRNIKF